MPRHLPILFILMTLMIDAIGFGLIMPVMPALLQDVTGGSLSHAALWGGVLAMSFAVMQFLFGPVMGSLSDRFGRRPVLLASLGVLALDYLVMALAGTIWLLLAARIVAGITAATQSTAAAFIADISPPEQKAANFGLIGAAFGIGFVLGPALGGLLAEFGLRAPFYAAGALAALNFLFGWLVMPETVNARNRSVLRLRNANPFATFGDIRRLPGLTRLLILFFLYEFAFMAYPVTWSYFAIAQFGWSPGMIGVSLALFGLCYALVQGALIRPVLRALGERGTIVFGLSVNALAFAALAVVQSGELALMLIPLSALGGVVIPSVHAIMSRNAPDNAQGALQGVLTSTRAVAMVMSPLVMTQIFAYFTSSFAPLHFPGAVFMLSMLLVLVCLVIALTEKRDGIPA